MLSEVDEHRARIREDLSPQIRGEVRTDPLTISLYATDGSLYQIPPLAVIAPRDAADVVAVVKFAAAEQIPVFARGSGTGIAGDSLGEGLVLDFSRFMRHVEAIDDKTVRVQPGIVYSQLNRVLRPYGRYFPPDPSNSSVTTIGSMLAVDAAGSHSIRVGSTRDHVASLDLVLANGSQMTVGRENVATARQIRTDFEARLRGGEVTPTELALDQSLIARLADILERNRDLIARHQPSLPRNRCGYYLRGILTEERLDAARFLVGSEGTLALTTSATLHTMPLPKHRGVALLLFPHLEAAVRTVQELIPHDPSACDLLDRRVLSLACDGDARFRTLIPATAETALIVEQTGYSAAEVSRRLRLVVAAAEETVGGDLVVHLAETPEEVDFLWSLPETVVPLLARMPGVVRPLPFVEDVAVPPAALNEFLVRAQGVFRKHRVIASLYAHAAAGQVHLRPFLPPPGPETARQLDEIARDLYEVVYQVGGTISGEHGAGLSRSAYIQDQYGPLYEVFREIKRLFDPAGLFNPGKVITDDRELATKNLRPAPVEPTATVELQLKWTAPEVLQAASRCNGCGQCRTREPELRMCPLFRVEPTEEASPRAKANLMRQLLSGDLPADSMKTPEFKRLADLCYNCKQCVPECPSNVDIPHLMIEAKAGYVVEEGLSRADWVLSRMHTLGTIGSAASVAINWALENPAMRWLIEKATGVSRLRKLPPFARRNFLRLAQRELLTRPGLRGAIRPVVFFVDHYANFHDPELARAFVAILKHHRIPVYVPPLQTTSGMALISAGDLEGARELALRNLRELADFAREGCEIVCTEPSAALCLKQEYPLLVDHPDVEIVARQTIEAGAYLARLHGEKLLRTDMQRLDLVIGYHTPCHLRSLGAGTPLADLLGLIPGLKIHRMEHGCSGMAGTWGLTQANFAQSIRIGWGLISRMRQTDLVVGTTECSGCKMQMEQGTATPTLHPLKLLALAYGLMPELKHKLRPSRKKLLVT
ncbi:MAG: FAD-binding protein [Planctomycetota bacterium]|nr:FAD-binding protein [Planctomycetota bacterium]